MIYLPESRRRGLNERVERDGHYLVVVEDGVKRAQVACPHCGLLERPSRVVGDGAEAARLADAALCRFVDKSCEGVRLTLIAEDVMLT